MYFHIWSEYKATIAGITTNRNILIKISLTYGRQPINEPRQITWHPCDSLMWPTFLQTAPYPYTPGVWLSSASFQSFITSKFVEIPDKTIVYKLTNVHEIDLLTTHAES